jgi:methylenetetrahydrofolate dehydrogenase (NADP+) / methenyltetrahydrofolate cyclohydrolase
MSCGVSSRRRRLQRRRRKAIEAAEQGLVGGRREEVTETRIIDGKAYAAGLRDRVAAAARALSSRHGVVPGLVTVLVGADPASQVYVRRKGKAAAEAGFGGDSIVLPETMAENELLALIARLNADAAVDGILVQLPLPRQISSDRVIAAIDPAKDVDGFHPVNVAALWSGGAGSGDDPAAAAGLVPCTPLGCLMLLRDAFGGGGLAGREAVVVGRSHIVGKPMAGLLIGADCTVTVAHSRTRDLPAVCRRADILVAAVGRPEIVRGDWLRPGVTVIDVGINRVDAGGGKSRLVGDVAFAEAQGIAGAITPVPGGVGPMTIACLMRNTLVAACRRRGLAVPPELTAAATPPGGA